MRTTVRIDDDLMRELKSRAHGDRISLNQLINRLIRHGMEAIRCRSTPAEPYSETTFSLGQPAINLDKALAIAATLEEQNVVEKMAYRK
jgi:hypothetical protein